MEKKPVNKLLGQYVLSENRQFYILKIPYLILKIIPGFTLDIWKMIRTLIISVSTLDEYPGTSVGGEIFVNYKEPWHTLHEGVPSYGEWVPSSEEIMPALPAWKHKL